MPAPIEVRKVPLHNVSDASELAKLIDDGVIEADRVIAVIGKTEGNGGINDYTRIIADRAFREVLVEKGAVGDDPGVVVDATVALGLADDGDDSARLHDAVVDELRELGGVGDSVDRNLADLNGFWHGWTFLWCG